MPYTSAQLIWLVSKGFPTAALRDLSSQSPDELDREKRLVYGLALKLRGQLTSAELALEELSKGSQDHAEEALFALMELDVLQDRMTKIQDRLCSHPQSQKSTRGKLFSARVLAKSDETGALAEMQMLASSNDANPHLRRLAAFDAVKLLDKSGHFKAAIDLANQFHRTMAGGSSP